MSRQAMSWKNVRLIWFREMRDQLRDRRTLFTILVLPVLLYPLLGMTFLQVAQFLKEHPTRVLVMGRANAASEPALFEGRHVAASLAGERERQLLLVEFDDRALPADQIESAARKAIDAEGYDAVLALPPGLGETFEPRSEDEPKSEGTAEPARPAVFVDNAATDRSRIARGRIDRVLERWREAIVSARLEKERLPAALARPFEIKAHDVSAPEQRRAIVWSKILPFVLMIWALTGAFYPAIDLCAGEKERGTLETLLSSSATRGEIVWGKLLTVATFSLGTSVLNMLSMATSGGFVMGQLAGGDKAMAESMGAPPLASVLWLLIALPPIAALFGALSLAVAAFARSSKEGQYYLMPLLLGLLPLMMLPMLPNVRLDVGTSLIPVTGLMLLLRGLMEGQIAAVWPYFFPVTAVTGAGCWLATRWAIDQFNRESVLFRESERGGLGVWLRHLLRDREDTPTVGQAMLAAVILLVIRFVTSQSMARFAEPTERWLFGSTLAIAVAFVATPVVLMAIVLTRSPRKALALEAPSFWITAPAAVALAIALHPALTWMSVGIAWIYPPAPEMAANLARFQPVLDNMPLWKALVAIALAPAICEELAFRGFLLSGFRRIGHKWTAIALAAVFFGVIHMILQQSIAAAATGMVLGYIAVKTGSLLPAVLYHLTHNALVVLIGRVDAQATFDYPWLQVFLDRVESDGATGHIWSPTWAVCGFFVATAIALWFKSLPYRATKEERLQEAISEGEKREPTPAQATTLVPIGAR